MSDDFTVFLQTSTQLCIIMKSHDVISNVSAAIHHNSSVCCVRIGCHRSIRRHLVRFEFQVEFGCIYLISLNIVSSCSWFQQTRTGTYDYGPIQICCFFTFFFPSAARRSEKRKKVAGADLKRANIVKPNIAPQIAKFMGPTWDPPGSCRPQMGPMLAPWILLSGQ